MDDWFGNTIMNYRGGDHYDTAQICLNGHVINSSAQDFPQHNLDFCSDCGQPTITKCKHCQTDIRGSYSTVMGGYDVPKYCHHCGKAYPWTEERMKAAKELADEAENLSHEEKEQLKQTFDDLVKDSPKTPVAASRYKRLTAKAGSMLAEGLKSILIELMVSNAKDLIWATHVK